MSRARQRSYLADPPKSYDVLVRERMRANRPSRTKPETTLFSALRADGIKGIRRNVRELPGTPDLVISSSLLAIFVHGCFWHRCPRCQKAVPKSNRNFWLAKFALNARRDRRVKARLRRIGWRTLTVWECGINERLVGQTRRVLKRL